LLPAGILTAPLTILNDLKVKTILPNGMRENVRYFAFAADLRRRFRSRGAAALGFE